MQRTPPEEMEKLKEAMLGSKYILDVPRYEILANPDYCNKFEFYDTFMSVNEDYEKQFTKS